MKSELVKTAELAGFFAAHGIWCVSEGEDLIPMVAFENDKDERNMHRFVAKTLEASVAEAQKYVARNPDSAARLAIVYDGRITLPSGKVDALIIEGHSYKPPRMSFSMALPYRSAKDPRGFAVHKPKILELQGAQLDASALGEAFFAGAYSHEKATPIWNQHLDESI